MAKIELYFLLIAAIGLDLLVGDPFFLPHPVQIIGYYIRILKDATIYWIKGELSLVFSGLFICLSATSLSYSLGKYIELKYFASEGKFLWGIILVIGIASCLASKSLIVSVLDISNLTDEQFIDESSKNLIKEKVQRIVSRDVSLCSLKNLLRSTTESLTENSVDGIFGPLFWIFIGTILIKNWIFLPGPLSLGFAYKTISTLDSMIGYKYIPYKYLGFFSAKVEDYITFIPCRLVLLTLPLVSRNIKNYFYYIREAYFEGSKYESPNSGLSEGIFAFVINIQLGGENKYQDKIISKPILNRNGINPTSKSIKKICELILKLQILWTLIFSLLFFII